MQASVYPSNFEKNIGFDKIRALVSANCKSDIGKEYVNNMAFQANAFEIRNQLIHVDEFRTILLEKKHFPVIDFTDDRVLLNKIKDGGCFYEPDELVSIRVTLEIMSAVLRFFKKCEKDEFPGLIKLLGAIEVFPFVKDRIDKIITPKGRIKDNASPELRNIRKKLKEKDALVSKRMQKIFATVQKEGWVDDRTNVALRNGRLVIPIPSANKKKLKGIVHDESATGKTTFVEPMEIVELNNDIRNYENEERREIKRILLAFSDDVRPYSDDLIKHANFLGELDFIRSKARLALSIKSVIPEITEKVLFDWKKAIHPLLFLTFQKEKKKVVAQDIFLNEQKRIMVISGPNAGGKSVCLQTVAMLQYMLQCGLLVPVDVSSKFGIVEKILIDMGDEQSIEDDLSTYSSHLKNMKYFMRHADENTLILIDEFGVGTEPSLGGAIAESIMERLNNLHAFGVITTHYANLKYFASNADGIINAAMLFDTHEMKPLFKLRQGSPGSSFAFEVAHKIGLPNDVLATAKSKTGDGQVKFDKFLREISRDKQYIETKRKNIRKKERYLEQLLEKYEQTFGDLKKERKSILKKAKDEAQMMLKEANKTIENTIRKIKESNADKEKTRKIREEFEKTKDKITKKESDLPKTQLKKYKSSYKPKPVVGKKKQPKVLDKKLSPGDHALLKTHHGTTGLVEILEIKKNEAVVALGSMTMKVKIRDLQKVADNQLVEKIPASENLLSIQQQISKKRLDFKPDIDVRGMKGVEALDKVINHIDDAIMLGVTHLKILHGTGHGILRKIIRDYLMSVDEVISAKDEDIQLGGSGITVVELQ